MATYNEATINDPVLDLSGQGGDVMAMVVREHVVAVQLDWTVKSGKILISTVDGGMLAVVFDSDDQGVECSDAYTDITRWLGGKS